MKREGEYPTPTSINSTVIVKQLLGKIMYDLYNHIHIRGEAMHMIVGMV